jgi:transcriptional regulator with XRE-family HTH domain
MLRIRVREIAEQKGFNISTLSRTSDVSQNTVRRLWHDQNRYPDLAVLERLSKVLEVATGSLIEDIPPR